MRNVCMTLTQGVLNDQNEQRDFIDLLRSRLRLLSGKDRLLMTMYLEKGNSYRQLALLAGIHERNIARRIGKITKRLINSEYITCLHNRDKFNQAELVVAKEHFLEGLSIRQIAENSHTTYYQIHKIIDKIKVCTSDKTQFSEH
jgi:predicted DNA-binding protein YlxM (UPF0122 family)